MTFLTGVSIDSAGALPGLRDVTDIASLRCADGGAMVAFTTATGTPLRFLGADGQTEGRLSAESTDAALGQTQVGNLLIVRRMSSDTYRGTRIDVTNTLTGSVAPDTSYAFSSLTVTATSGNCFVVAVTDIAADSGGNLAVDGFNGTTCGSSFYIDQSADPAADVQVVTMANGNLASAWVRQGRDAPKVMAAITSAAAATVLEPKRQSFFAFPDDQSSIQEAVTKNPSIIVIGSTVDLYELRVGTVAQNADDLLIYDPANGRLYFDADGRGERKQFVISNVAIGNTLLVTDIEMIV